jgi:hypothetical protein
MEPLFDYLLKVIAYTFNAGAHWLRLCGTGEWPLAYATITAPPTSSPGLGCPKAEIVYSYRIDGELYTRIHGESLSMADSLAAYVARFREGRSLVVRVKPGNPDVSIVCEADQAPLYNLSVNS